MVKLIQTYCRKHFQLQQAKKIFTYFRSTGRHISAWEQSTHRTLWWSWPHTGAVILLKSLQSGTWRKGTPPDNTQDPGVFSHFPTFQGWQTSTHGNRTLFRLSMTAPEVLATQSLHGHLVEVVPLSLSRRRRLNLPCTRLADFRFVGDSRIFWRKFSQIFRSILPR
jgi:hypothetical protein